MNRIRYFRDKKHFGDTVSIYDNTGWYFIVIKDRSDYYYSAMSKDKKHYYNIDNHIRKLDYEIIDSEVIKQNIDVDLSNTHQTDVPDYIQLLMQTGSIYGKKIIRSYKPRRKKFEQQVEEYFKINQSFFCEVLRDVVYESIDANLLNRLPVFMFHRLYRKSKKGIIIHYEGEYNNIWFQCIFAEEGLMLMIDSFVPDNKYSPDGYIDYNNFTSKVKMYEFIIEAFEHYHDRVSKKDFDSIEVLNEYINKQKEVK